MKHIVFEVGAQNAHNDNYIVTMYTVKPKSIYNLIHEIAKRCRKHKQDFRITIHGYWDRK